MMTKSKILKTVGFIVCTHTDKGPRGGFKIQDLSGVFETWAGATDYRELARSQFPGAYIAHASDPNRLRLTEPGPAPWSE